VHVRMTCSWGAVGSTALAVPHPVGAITSTLRSGVSEFIPHRRLTRVPAGTASATHQPQQREAIAVTTARLRSYCAAAERWHNIVE
jgi:hypothetical protein